MIMQAMVPFRLRSFCCCFGAATATNDDDGDDVDGDNDDDDDNDDDEDEDGGGDGGSCSSGSNDDNNDDAVLLLMLMLLMLILRIQSILVVPHFKSTHHMPDGCSGHWLVVGWVRHVFHHCPSSIDQCDISAIRDALHL